MRRYVEPTSTKDPKGLDFQHELGVWDGHTGERIAAGASAAASLQDPKGTRLAVRGDKIRTGALTGCLGADVASSTGRDAALTLYNGFASISTQRAILRELPPGCTLLQTWGNTSVLNRTTSNAEEVCGALYSDPAEPGRVGSGAWTGSSVFKMGVYDTEPDARRAATACLQLLWSFNSDEWHLKDAVRGIGGGSGGSGDVANIMGGGGGGGTGGAVLGADRMGGRAVGHGQSGDDDGGGSGGGLIGEKRGSAEEVGGSLDGAALLEQHGDAGPEVKRRRLGRAGGGGGGPEPQKLRNQEPLRQLQPAVGV